MSFSTFCRFVLAGLALSMTLGWAGTGFAVAPAAPTITRVDFSNSGFKRLISGDLEYDANGLPVVDATGTGAHSYVVRFQDNSLDEEGFIVDARVGGGAFSTLTRLNANTREIMLSPMPAFPAGTVLDFRVSAWKFNGAAIETGVSTLSSFTIPNVAVTLSTPTNLAVANVNDGSLKLTWTDTATSELYYQILFREVKTPAINYSHVYFINLFGSNALGTNAEETLRHRLVPGKSYEFLVRGTRQAPSGSNPTFSSGQTTGFSGVGTAVIPALSAPTQLSATALRENLVRLQWRDNSSNETGYRIEYRDTTSADPNAFTVYATTEESVTSTNISLPQNLSLEWRVVAVYTYTPSGATTPTTLVSPPSNKATVSTDFPAPVLLTAVTSPGTANTVDLTWEDKSNSEGGFNVYTRPQGTSTFHFARAVRAGVEKVSVNSRTEANDSNGRPIFVPLAAGVTHEFLVLAVSSDEQTFSADSNILSATAKDGFTSRLYQPCQVGVPFLYQLTTSNAANRVSWNVSGLPLGLNFNNQSGEIGGTPIQTGVFNCQMTATFTGSVTSTATLVLRVLRASVQPVIGSAFTSTRVGINTPLNIPLGDKFSDSDSEQAVQIKTTKGDMNVLLYPSLAPQAVANFMAYVNAGDYNGMAFHRLIQGFVLQGGSLKPVNFPKTFLSIPGRPPAPNEPGISHVYGTLAAAKVGSRYSVATLTNGSKEVKDDDYGYVGDPDSATTDFFFNLANNSSNLDNQNGGFTAFGRIGNGSLSVLDAIAFLPSGDYVDGNTTSSYNAALDKRLIVDGSPAEFTDIPMDATSAPADMDINKTVQVSKIVSLPVLTYHLTSNPTGIAKAEVVGTDLRITGLVEGSTLVTVIAQDLDNRTISQSFTVNVTKNYKAPVITRQPVVQAVLANAKATFSVTATGTSLVYRWRKDGVVIDGQTGAGLPTLTIASAQNSNVGLYDVQVSNESTTVTSNRVRLDIRTQPAITQPLTHQLFEVGKPLVLQTTASGAPAPTFAWKRGNTTVTSVTSPLQPDGFIVSRVNIAAAKLTDAGAYSVTATNLVNKATSNTASICVVDKTTVARVVTLNTSLVSLTAAVAGPPGSISYRWRRDGVDIPLNTARYTGMEEAILKITGAQHADSGSYTCRATLPDGLGTVETGAVNLAVVIRPSMPDLTNENAPPTAYIGVDYYWPLPYTQGVVNTPTGFSISNLPPGLTYSKTTGIITGRPTKVGVFELSATVSNPAGTSTPVKKAKITVSPMPAPVVGTLTATVGASEPINNNMGGRLDLTVTDGGSYSAKLILGKDTLSAVGALVVNSGLFDINTLSYQSRISIPRKAPLSALSLAFEIDDNYGYVSGVLSDGNQSVAIRGIRQFWEGTLRPSTFFSMNKSSQLFNLGIELADADVGKTTVPQGAGYISMNVGFTGRASFAGRMADGTSITGSSIVGPGGEALLFQMLYANTGSVLATFDIGDQYLNYQGNARLRVDGSLRWFKDPSTSTSERSYASGIPETYLTVLGADYQVPASAKIVMDIPNTTSPVADNVSLDFSEGGLGTAAPNPDLSLRLTSTNTAVYPADNATTGAKVALTLTPSTGAYTGGFTLNDGRKVTYQGLIIPAIPATPVVTTSGGINTAQAEIPGAAARGVGYFLLPELLPSVTKSKINSGKVLLLPKSIQITTQPLAQTVNPGANVTLSVSATGQGTLTYRWRKNGIALSGATTSVLSLTNVTEASQGTYDCVISNGPATQTSSGALLSINDAVTAVTATRTPAASVIATAQQVTFSVTQQGTGPFTYQWRKNSTDIPGATASSYVISSASEADSGNYQVIVKNSVSTTGVSSNNVSLTVAAPVVITSTNRSPADTNIASGTPVTFSVVQTGTSPFTYQWRKDGTNITGATAATYTINAPTPADNGSYDVVIKNIISTTGVPSPTPVALLVDP